MLVTRKLVITQLQPRRFMRKEKRTLGRRMGDWLWRGKEWNPDKPPYGHVVQIGDPVLRAKANKVDFDKVSRAEIEAAAKALTNALDNNHAVGMSAPQIGLSWQMLAIRVTEDQIDMMDAKDIAVKDVQIVPLTIIINPRLNVVNHKEVLEDSESCASFRGFSCRVPRYREVEVRGYNVDGTKMVPWHVKNYTARIIQHEVDHLDGLMTVDRMVSSQTLEFAYWSDVNRKRGNFKMSYDRERLRGLLKYWYPKSLVKWKMN